MGARISTGKNNKQDYATPADFMAAVMKRFGPIAFDLAAHAGNTKSPNYFAPVTGPEGPLPFDPEAYGMDAFDHSWANLSCKHFGEPGCEESTAVPTLTCIGNSYTNMARFPGIELRPKGRKGLLWLNCEFNDIPRWHERVLEESEKGANILSLTPASAGSVWFDTLVAAHANVYLFRPRLAFIPGESYNKDCMLSHFVSPSNRDSDFPFICTWDWKRDKITHFWRLTIPGRP